MIHTGYRAATARLPWLLRGDSPMHRLCLASCLVVLSMAAGEPARAAIEDEEPTVAGKKLSEWIQILKTDKEENRRRASLTALKIIASQLETAKAVPPVV